MNHGRCINCWWYKTIKGRHWITTNSGLVENLGNGKCYMHNGGNDTDADYTFVGGDCYCPDYCNRKEGDREEKMTLDEWIEKRYGND